MLTCIAAVLTYLAVDQDSRAAAFDRQAVLEAAQFQGQLIAAETQVHAEAAAAAEYRRGRAEVAVLQERAARAAASGEDESAALLSDQALLDRLVLESVASVSFQRQYLAGTGATARHDEERQLQTLLARDRRAVPRSAARQTGERADQFHLSSRRLADWIVVLFAAVALLTLARLAQQRSRTLLVFTSAALSCVASLVALTQWALVTFAG